VSSRQHPSVRNVFLPNRPISFSVALVLVLMWSGALLISWIVTPYQSLPTPREVWQAFGDLWWNHGLGIDLGVTLRLILHSIALTVVIAMALSYATVVPLFRPVIVAVSKLRFLGLTGLIFPFTLWTGGGYALKVALLTFSMVSFFVTSMAQVVLEIPREAFDHMRVLGAGEGRILWEVVVLGTLDKALDVLRQNAAIGWAMITMVEGISRSEGGIGALILNQNKHFRLAEVYALLFLILTIGLLIDYGMGVLIRVLCPYAQLDRVRR
jgi:NitT/TauT family transport system permease protein